MALNFPSSPTNGQTYNFNGAYYTYNSTMGAWVTTSSGGGGGTVSLTFEVINSNTAMTQSGNYMVDTANGEIYITLPDSPTSGDVVSFVDMLGDKTVNSAIIRTNTSTINDSSSDFYFDVPNIKFDLVYTGSTWKVFA